ncbi:MAG: hypothetical protein MJ198_09785 [Bacteroidales bacterium]|nr:hypothetical protein [Bacteroidales bacterium]
MKRIIIFSIFALTLAGCGATDTQIQNAYVIGLEEGKIKGFNEGYEQGQKDGYEKGYDAGLETAITHAN